MNIVLDTMSAYDVQQRILVVANEPLVQLAHERRLMDKGKATERMNVGKVLLDYPSQMSLRW